MTIKKYLTVNLLKELITESLLVLVESEENQILSKLREIAYSDESESNYNFLKKIIVADVNFRPAFDYMKSHDMITPIINELTLYEFVCYLIGTGEEFELKSRIRNTLKVSRGQELTVLDAKKLIEEYKNNAGWAFNNEVNCPALIYRSLGRKQAIILKKLIEEYGY